MFEGQCIHEKNEKSPCIEYPRLVEKGIENSFEIIDACGGENYTLLISSSLI
jgi:hypothetical protein